MVKGKSNKNGALKINDKSILRSTAPSPVSKAEGQRAIEILLPSNCCQFWLRKSLIKFLKSAEVLVKISNVE